MVLDSYGLILPTNFALLARSLALWFAHCFSKLAGKDQSGSSDLHRLHSNQVLQLNQGSKQPDVLNHHYQVKVLIRLLPLQSSLYQRLLILF